MTVLDKSHKKVHNNCNMKALFTLHKIFFCKFILNQKHLLVFQNNNKKRFKQWYYISIHQTTHSLIKCLLSSPCPLKDSSLTEGKMHRNSPKTSVFINQSFQDHNISYKGVFPHETFTQRNTIITIQLHPQTQWVYLWESSFHTASCSHYKVMKSI